MRRRLALVALSLLACPPGLASAQRAPDPEEAAIRDVVRRYVDARVSEDPKVIEALLTPEADQLVSDGTWRRGRDALVKGMLESSKKNQSSPSIDVESVRKLAPDVAMADGRYTLKPRGGGPDRVMWTSITVRRGADGWRIAAIRNMLPASQPSPAASGAGPDPKAVLDEAVALAGSGHFEEALKKHVWFHENATRVEPAMAGVRLSFALADWVSLGEKYPKAREELVRIRDRDEEIVKTGTSRGSADAFRDVASIDRYLDQPARTVELFKRVDARDHDLAERCFIYAEETLAKAGEYPLCAKYIPDAMARLAREERFYRMLTRREKAAPKDAIAPVSSGPIFVDKTCRLIDILVGAGRKPEAEKVRERALQVHDDPRIRDAIAAAEAKQPKRE